MGHGPHSVVHQDDLADIRQATLNRPRLFALSMKDGCRYTAQLLQLLTYLVHCLLSTASIISLSAVVTVIL